MSDRRSMMSSLELVVVLLLLSAHPIFSLIRRPSNSSAPHDCATASVACESDPLCSLLLRSLFSMCGTNEARCAAPAADVDKCVSIVRTLQSSRHLSGCSCPVRHVRQLVQHPAPAGHSPSERQQCARIRALVFRHPCLRSAESRREAEATGTGAARTPDAASAQQPYEQVSLRLLLGPDFLAAPQPPPQAQDTSLSHNNPPHNGPPEPTPLSDTPPNSVPLCSQVRLKCLQDSSCEEELNSYSTQCRLKSCLHSTFTGSNCKYYRERLVERGFAECLCEEEELQEAGAGERTPVSICEALRTDLSSAPCTEAATISTATSAASRTRSAARRLRQRVRGHSTSAPLLSLRSGALALTTSSIRVPEYLLHVFWLTAILAASVGRTLWSSI